MNPSVNPRPSDASTIPAGLTPLVQMFPMHIGEPASPPSPGRDAANPSPERSPTTPGRSISQAG